VRYNGIHHATDRIHNACEDRVISVDRDRGFINIYRTLVGTTDVAGSSRAGGGVTFTALNLSDHMRAFLRQARLVIQARWESNPLVFAGKLQPRRPNN
jgi:hypothetical protein